MDVYFTQEMKELSRHCPRLSRKLSHQEIRTLLDFIDTRVQQENAELLHKLTYLEMSRDVTEKSYSRTLSQIQKEVEQDKTIAQEYKRSFGNISQVLANREERFEGKYQNALKEIESMEDSLKNMDHVKYLLQEENERKDALIGDLHLDIDVLKKNNEERADYYEIMKENSMLNQQVLKQKLDLDREKRNNANLLKDVAKLREEMRNNSSILTRFTSLEKPVQYPLEPSAILKDGFLYGKPHDLEVSGLLNMAGFKMAAPQYQCRDVNCRASRDLVQCRAHLVKQCEENSRLQQLLSNARRRQQQQQQQQQTKPLTTRYFSAGNKDREPIRLAKCSHMFTEPRFPEFRKINLLDQRNRAMSPSISATYPRKPLLGSKNTVETAKASYRK